MPFRKVTDISNVKKFFVTDKKHFMIREADGIEHVYRLYKAKHQEVYWVQVQVWDGAWVFTAGINNELNLFRCKPKWTTNREYTASGIPKSVNMDVTSLNMILKQIKSGQLPKNVEFFEAYGKMEMTEVEHKEVGEYIHQAKQHLTFVVHELRKHYPKSSKIMKIAERLCSSSDLTELQWLLEANEGKTVIGSTYFRPYDKAVMKKLGLEP